jgi:hypothetical protein
MAMTLRLADDETDALRRRAELEQLLDQVLDEELPRYAEALERLGQWSTRLALAAVIAFYGLNGRRLTLTNDAAYDLVISVAAGHLDTVDAIAAILQTATRRRR